MILSRAVLVGSTRPVAREAELIRICKPGTGSPWTQTLPVLDACHVWLSLIPRSPRYSRLLAVDDGKSIRDKAYYGTSHTVKQEQPSGFVCAGAGWLVVHEAVCLKTSHYSFHTRNCRLFLEAPAVHTHDFRVASRELSSARSLKLREEAALSPNSTADFQSLPLNLAEQDALSTSRDGKWMRMQSRCTVRVLHSKIERDLLTSDTNLPGLLVKTPH
jgi:hypothetical protein